VTARPAATNQTAQPAPPLPVAPPPYQTGCAEHGRRNSRGAAVGEPDDGLREDIKARPLTRPGEIVEAAPGLIATNHSDGGKANQYYLRGWNLDHGTDQATFVYDVQINLPSNVHGQDYTDLNWLISETVNGVEIRKGSYFADVGDFENAGNLHISLRDSVDQNIVSVTAGSFGYMRYLALGSTKVDGGGNLLYDASSAASCGIARVRRRMASRSPPRPKPTTGTPPTRSHCGPSAPGRSVFTGELGPTDGGDNSRYSPSARLAQSDSDGLWKANVYFVKYTPDLFDNFTWDTIDPANGDQFHQHEDRLYMGGCASRTIARLEYRHTNLQKPASRTLQIPQTKSRSTIFAPALVMNYDEATFRRRTPRGNRLMSRADRTDWRARLFPRTPRARAISLVARGSYDCILAKGGG
jgi:TonB-dependent Receptor Plug Domain